MLTSCPARNVSFGAYITVQQAISSFLLFSIFPPTFSPPHPHTHIHNCFTNKLLTECSCSSSQSLPHSEAVFLTLLRTQPCLPQTLRCDFCRFSGSYQVSSSPTFNHTDLQHSPRWRFFLLASHSSFLLVVELSLSFWSTRKS